MASNTKLSTHQKACRKELMTIYPAVKLVNDGKTTIAYELKGNTVQFSLSVMSPEEKKFRRKVGEYYALEYYYEGQRVSMDKYDFANMLDTTFGLYAEYVEFIDSF